MAKQYDLAVYIGRFQPFHLGHLHVLEHCNRIADQTLVLVGSCFRPRTLKNPFTYEERREMIQAAARSIGARVNTRALRDYKYRDNQWVSQVSSLIQDESGHRRVALVGHFKDDSSWYLNAFPGIELVTVDDYERISATPLREKLLETTIPLSEWGEPHELTRYLPNSTTSWLWDNVDTALEGPRDDQAFVNLYQSRWGKGPFLTADSIVTCQGHVLLVKRANLPGKGLWAIPGGFVEPHETLLDAALREACEETGLNIAKGALLGSHCFDAPDRSSRGRIVTHAFYFDISPMSLPDVTGADDAEEAKWVPMNQITSENMFEDHYDILDYFQVWELN